MNVKGRELLTFRVVIDACVVQWVWDGQIRADRPGGQTDCVFTSFGPARGAAYWFELMSVGESAEAAATGMLRHPHFPKLIRALVEDARLHGEALPDGLEVETLLAMHFGGCFGDPLRLGDDAEIDAFMDRYIKVLLVLAGQARTGVEARSADAGSSVGNPHRSAAGGTGMSGTGGGFEAEEEAQRPPPPSLGPQPRGPPSPPAVPGALTPEVVQRLKAWFEEHITDPYPTEEEKVALGAELGLTLGQLQTWFGNKRMRYKRKLLKVAPGDLGPRKPSRSRTSPPVGGSAVDCQGRGGASPRPSHGS